MDLCMFVCSCVHDAGSSLAVDFLDLWLGKWVQKTLMICDGLACVFVCMCLCDLYVCTCDI